MDNKLKLFAKKNNDKIANNKIIKYSKKFNFCTTKLRQIATKNNKQKPLKKTLTFWLVKSFEKKFNES